MFFLRSNLIVNLETAKKLHDYSGRTGKLPSVAAVIEERRGGVRFIFATTWNTGATPDTTFISEENECRTLISTKDVCVDGYQTSPE